jgi:hypothetical protein
MPACAQPRPASIALIVNKLHVLVSPAQEEEQLRRGTHDTLLVTNATLLTAPEWSRTEERSQESNLTLSSFGN